MVAQRCEPNNQVNAQAHPCGHSFASKALHMWRACAIGAFAACAGRTEGGRVFFPLPRKRGQASPLRRGRIPVQGQSTLVAPHGAGERQQSIDRTSSPRQYAIHFVNSRPSHFIA